MSGLPLTVCTRLTSQYIHVYISSFHVQGKGCMFAFTSKDRRFSFAHFSLSFAHLDCLHLRTILHIICALFSILKHCMRSSFKVYINGGRFKG